jgi:hypothetical protein
MVAWEIDIEPGRDVSPAAAPPAWRGAPPSGPVTPGAAEQAGHWAATALARPLFSPNRRPSTEAVAAGDQPLKLQGTIVVPAARLAIFAPPGGGKSVVVRERDRMGGLGIDEIRPGEVAATGPDGRVIFRLGRGSPGEHPLGSTAEPPGGSLPGPSREQGDKDRRSE